MGYVRHRFSKISVLICRTASFPASRADCHRASTAALLFENRATFSLTAQRTTFPLGGSQKLPSAQRRSPCTKRLSTMVTTSLRQPGVASQFRSSRGD